MYFTSQRTKSRSARGTSNGFASGFKVKRTQIQPRRRNTPAGEGYANFGRTSVRLRDAYRHACRTILLNLTPFHIAVQVRDIEEARHFYGDILNCPEGRSAAHWVDFNLYGHQFVCHLKFVIEPYVRFQGEPGEQATMFLLDPTGNALEFKSFKDISAQLFASE